MDYKAFIYKNTVVNQDKQEKVEYSKLTKTQWCNHHFAINIKPGI